MHVKGILIFHLKCKPQCLIAGRREIRDLIGGFETEIGKYPFIASLLFTSDLSVYSQQCVGSILNRRSVLTRATCFWNDSPDTWRIRVGSSYANSGGQVHATLRIISHPELNPYYSENDIAILHAAVHFTFSDFVSAGSIAGRNYVIADDEPVWAVGWGRSSVSATPSEIMRHIPMNYINIEKCKYIYVYWAMYPTDDMMCAVLDQNKHRNENQGEQGSPVLHNNVIVGLTAWGLQYLYSEYPGVSTRVSSYTPWIVANA
ncbi:trypsin CFT-1-like [Battus philenor]|uniref:trypsin CFT-1-like n=1 Tax=Battus philenor TaxID=42288 RepID=UPI0035D009DA